jgi:hypothetical protein
MDPYLEDPALFPGVHDRFVTYLSEWLQPRLPEPYYADTSDRVWVEVSERPIGPDVKVLHPGEGADESDVRNGGVALATRTQPVVIDVLHDEQREPFVNIYTRTQGAERLVTTIEILSRANKTPGDKGQELYLKKQREILDSSVSLVEIDLLRGGEPTTTGRRWWLKYGKPFDYHVCLCPSYSIKRYAYPFRLTDMLPEIAVPLLERDGSVAVDLQEVFKRVYDTGPYRRRVRYGVDEIRPPLTAEQRAWHDELLSKHALAQP